MSDIHPRTFHLGLRLGLWLNWEVRVWIDIRIVYIILYYLFIYLSILYYY